MFDFSGKTVLITGGSRGLGRKLVVAFANAGAKVAFTYKNDDASAADLEKSMTASGKDVVPLCADASDFERAHEVVRSLEDRWGRLDILVCNAGMARSAALWKMTEADWDAVLGVTLKSCFNYAHAASKGFMENNYGKILCVGSINGLRGRIGSLSYNVAKAGIVGFVKTVASELGRFNVNVNAIAPGFIETDSQTRTPELIRDLVLKECAIKRLAEPEDIAPLVLFLCSDAAGHITGQTIKIDAGQYM